MLNIILISVCIATVSGMSYKSFEGRIVNGTDAEEGEFPFIVSFRSASGHKCGGSIISPRFILTAAHCSNSERDQTIQYGTTRISRDSGNIVTIKKQIRHEQYNYNTLSNDIALLELDDDIKFSQYVSTIELPELDEVFADGDTAVLAGWGLNSTYFGVVQEHLQKVDLLVVNYEKCLEIHKTMVTSTNICAGVPGGWKGQCSGDSGGPLVYRQNNRTKLIGIVSWSVKPCTIPPYPGVFTRVASFIDWIKKKSN